MKDSSYTLQWLLQLILLNDVVPKSVVFGIGRLSIDQATLPESITICNDHNLICFDLESDEIANNIIEYNSDDLDVEVTIEFKSIYFK